jgi:hypothetical protein
MNNKKDVKDNLIQFPKKKNDFSYTDFLNKHSGCDFDKMMKGDLVEKEKSLGHFRKETLRVRSQFLNED